MIERGTIQETRTHLIKFGFQAKVVPYPSAKQSLSLPFDLSASHSFPTPSSQSFPDITHYSDDIQRLSLIRRDYNRHQDIADLFYRSSPSHPAEEINPLKCYMSLVIPLVHDNACWRVHRKKHNDNGCVSLFFSSFQTQETPHNDLAFSILIDFMQSDDQLRKKAYFFFFDVTHEWVDTLSDALPPAVTRFKSKIKIFTTNRDTFISERSCISVNPRLHILESNKALFYVILSTQQRGNCSLAPIYPLD